MRILARYAEPLTLAELASRMLRKRLPQRAVAVTFDDGYADNFEEALPILKKHDIPALFFVIAGYLGSSQEFWWDEAERLLFFSGGLNPRAAMPVILRRSYPIAENQVACPAGRLDSLQNGYASLLRLLRPMDETGRKNLLRQLRGVVEQDPGPRTTHRILTRPELQHLVHAETMDIGSHTMTHAHLGSMDIRLQRQEISDSRQTLEVLLGKSISAFAYPYGDPASYGLETIEEVTRAGFTVACTVAGGRPSSGSFPYRISRLPVVDMDASSFRRILEHYFESY
jgi:peptidoglycan/xylan/chitin deacetylase (PgdA/CDA1 family)